MKIFLLWVAAVCLPVSAWAVGPVLEFGTFEEGDIAMSWERRGEGGSPARGYLVRITPADGKDEENHTVMAEVLEPLPGGDIDVVATWSFRVSAPQAVSASLGLIIGPSECDEVQICSPHGILVQVEPGIGGGKLSLGYASAGGLAMWKSWLLSVPLTGFDLKASLLDIWSEQSLGGQPGDYYVGAEGDFGFFMLKFSLGVFYRVFGESGTSDWLLSGGVGLGF